MRGLIALLATGIMGVVMYFAPAPAEQATGPSRYWVKIVFGVDQAEAQWDGDLAVRAGRLLNIEPWAFEERDHFDSQQSSWKVTTGIAKARRLSYAEPQRGLLVEVESTANTVVTANTKQGAVEFLPANLIPGRPVQLLNGRATAERLGTGQLVAKTQTDDDFAAIAVNAAGQRHVAWIAYDDEAKQNHLLLKNVDGDAAQPELISDGKEFADVRLFFLSDGTLQAFWCSPGEDRNWDLYTAKRNNRGWTTERLTTASGTDFQLAAATGDDGSLWLAWQSFRNGNGDIFAKCHFNGQWSDDITVTQGPANEWQPSISIGADGRAWIGYDTYQHGNYDVYLTHVRRDSAHYQTGPAIAVSTSPDFEAHANVLADGNRVWVAFDAAGPNWGKDFRNVPTINKGKYAEPLHASRRLVLRCVVDINGKQPTVEEPVELLPQILPPEKIPAIDRNPHTKPSRFYEFPQLARDGNGRLWMFFRMCRQGYCAHPPMGLDWSVQATTYTNEGWLEPIELPRSRGRQNQRVAFAVGKDGDLQCAWSEGNRFASVGRKYTVQYGHLPRIQERAAEIALEPLTLEPPTSSAANPQPAWTMKRDEEEYHLYFGDLHRHTNISRCSPTIDGSLTDAHRYALDAVQYDFLAVTDHTRDVDPFSWWRTQQASDWFHIPGKYVPIYGYERSNGTVGGGHRNVFFLERGHAVNQSEHWYLGRDLPRPDTNPDTTLYPWMKEQGGALTAAHTPVYAKGPKRGTWTYNDPQVEPVAEIYQSFRRSYERPDKGVAEEASLWFALQQGYKLGFIASSDHIATHTSYACVWAKEKSRSAIFEALQSRRTFAATDRIALDVRIGDVLMGEQTKLNGEQVTLSIRALGTDAIREVEIVRSGQVIGTLHPDRLEVNHEFVDAQPVSGDSYYYVRLVQHDDEVAWGSPIWVSR